MVGTSSGTPPNAAQLGRQRPGLLLGARHQDPPAEQRLRLEPRERVAHRHDLADHGHRGRFHPGSARVGSHVGERRDDRALLRRRAHRRHGDRRVAVAAGGSQCVGGGRDALDRRQQHDGLTLGVPGPVDLALGKVEHGDLTRRPGGERHAGVGGHRGHRADPRHDLEGDQRLGACGGLLRAGRVHPGVARDQAYDVLLALGVPDHELGPGGVRQQLAVLAVPAVDDHHLVEPVLEQRRQQRHVIGGLGDHDIRGPDQLQCTDREQPRVARDRCRRTPRTRPVVARDSSGPPEPQQSALMSWWQVSWPSCCSPSCCEWFQCGLCWFLAELLVLSWG